MSNENPGIRLKVECETHDVRNARDWLDRVKSEILRLFEERRRGAYGVFVKDLSDGAEVVDAERTPSSAATLVVDENNEAQMLLGAPNSTNRESSENVPGIQVDVMRPKKGNKKVGKWVLELREAMIALVQNEAGDLNGKAMITFSDTPDGDEIVIAEAVEAGEPPSVASETIYIGDDAPDPKDPVKGKQIRMESLHSSNVVSYGKRADGGYDLWPKESRQSDQTEPAGDSPFASDSEGKSPFRKKRKLFGGLRRLLSYDLGRLFWRSRG